MVSFQTSITYSVHACSTNYSGHRHRVLRWARIVFCNIIINFFFFFFWGGGGSSFGLTLIGWCATNMSSMSSGKGRNVGERSVLCLPNLALWTDFRTLISRTDADAGCGRPTLNFIEHFEPGSLHSDTAKPLLRAQAAPSYIVYIQIILPV